MGNNMLDDMDIEYNINVKEVVAGTIALVAVAAGVAIGGISLATNMKLSNTQVACNGQEYDLGSLYLVKDGDSETLCYKEELSRETKVGIMPGVQVGDSKFMISPDGDVGLKFAGGKTLAVGYGMKEDVTYGYMSLNSNELMCTSADAKESGYEVTSVKKYVSYEEAKDSQFRFSFDEITAKIEMQQTNGISR